MFPLFAELFETFSRARKSFLLLINTEAEWVEEEGVKEGLKAPLQMSMGIKGRPFSLDAPYIWALPK